MNENDKQLILNALSEIKDEYHRINKNQRKIHLDMVRIIRDIDSIQRRLDGLWGLSLASAFINSIILMLLIKILTSTV